MTALAAATDKAGAAHNGRSSEGREPAKPAHCQSERKARARACAQSAHARAKRATRENMGGTGLEPVTPSLSSWCSPN
jgi:hypothetical protein